MLKNYLLTWLWSFTGPKTYIHFSRKSLFASWLFFASSISLLLLLAFGITWLRYGTQIRLIPTLLTNEVVASMPLNTVVTWSNGEISSNVPSFEVGTPNNLRFLFPAEQSIAKLDPNVDHTKLTNQTSGPLLVISKQHLSILSGYYQSQVLADLLPAHDLKITKQEVTNYGHQAQTWWNTNFKLIISTYLATLIVVTIISHSFVVVLDSLMIWGFFWLIRRQAHFKIILKWSLHLAVVAKALSLLTATIPNLVPISYGNSFWALWAGMMIWLWYQRLGWSK